MQKSPHSARAGEEAGWAERRHLTGSLHRNTPEVRSSLKSNGFPQTEQALDRRPCQSPPLLLAVTLLYQKFVFWVRCRVCLQAMPRVTQRSHLRSEKNPCCEGCGSSEGLYCFTGRSGYLLKRAIQAVAEQKLPGQSNPAPQLATAESSHVVRTLFSLWTFILQAVHCPPSARIAHVTRLQALQPSPWCHR